MAIFKRMKYHQGVDEVLKLLETHNFVAVWKDSSPLFAVDRSFSKKQIIALFKIYVHENDILWYDGS